MNAGFLASHGEIICFLDSDDFYTINKIEKIVEIFQSYPEIGWCFHPLKYIGNVLDVWKWGRIRQVVFPQFVYGFGTRSLPRLWQ
ncbi:glycosyltransferase [Phormidium sp. CLA17]|nr:glycosyltransferase [Leptolyngbya sp. Cla-17]